MIFGTELDSLVKAVGKFYDNQNDIFLCPR